MNNVTINEIQRFSFDNSNVRGERVLLNDAYQEIIKRKQYPLALEKLLGEFVAAIALLRDIVKIDGVLSIQAKGYGFLSTLMTECDEHQNLRGIAQWDESQEVPEVISLKDVLEGGYLAITIQPRNGQRYQGIVEIVGDTLAECLEQYFSQSEQLPSRVWLAANGAQCGGLFLQRLPEEQAKEGDEDAWERLTHLASTVKEDELLGLETGELLHRLYHEEEVRLYDTKVMQFGCSCSRQRTLDAVMSLGSEEIRELLIEQGSVKVDCQFCAEKYEFTEADLVDLLGDQAKTH
ncbi:MAG: Hsp33 family molecular chaperone HslO [Gammaproteobacteria bacterium]|uniref:Hsp33 family molecular chaperone HslO n=1 Tax=Marinomonas TaxID=28253 RepID=UPI000C1E114D|nr:MULTISPECIES: Hsp33 family molecular chaperone HslO [unclassified Marinomonas]MBU1294105.1 Hsp33 family molecular chaperone HslO [Gammaproteobacteria bacterium]MBU1467446.1 Hsp33 family molecular chaperone HslO [Gammaproteobacteria bacterium]MBU2025013.1 Hsp33 family molecular chaperone HslO [Gammaproteobacteria bacterium]MBU2240664.1 Hsp33 family molecular chaperone HslO [Gammaproteobacteria bacterium]MBU2318165.1 Hsp33 family molecular chaperone HslO [Gammaproteobacteria bacterium]